MSCSRRPRQSARSRVPVPPRQDDIARGPAVHERSGPVIIRENRDRRPFHRSHLAVTPMRVAFLAVDINLSGYTGDVSHVKDLAVALAEQGCEVDLVVADSGDWAAGNLIRLH